MRLKNQEMRNLIIKTLNSIENRPAEVSMSSANLAYFATLGTCNLGENSLSNVFFDFLYTGLDSTNRQNLKKNLRNEGKIRHRTAYTYNIHFESNN